MENAEGICSISLANHATRISDHEVLCAKDRIYPTTNGIAIQSTLQAEPPYVFSLEISKPFLAIQANDKYFSLMSNKFQFV